MSFPRRRLEAPALELAPLVDVLFLLLVFFMVATRFPDPPGAITVVRPAVSAQGAVPERAVMQGPQGPFLYTVGADGNAQVKPVKLGMSTPEGRIIDSGLDAGARQPARRHQSRSQHGCRRSRGAEQLHSAHVNPHACEPVGKSACE